jgi:hypothetical protein
LLWDVKFCVKRAKKLIKKSPRETGKSFSISSILENNEESSKKDNTNVPAIISKLEFPENSSKNILTKI